MAECPVRGESGSSSATDTGCPVKGDNKVNDASYNAAASDFSYNQHRQPGQVKDMSTVRPVSGIPKSTFTPGHQFANVDRWVYPSGKLNSMLTFNTIKVPSFISSCQNNGHICVNFIDITEQQYYNAMKKKGYDPAEDDMPVILAIHNIVNEQGWSKVKEWESLRGCLNPKLKQFQGRPKDISPKAYLMSLMG